MCVSKNESTLFNGKDVQLHILEGVFLSRDRHFLADARDSMTDMSWKIF